MSGICDILDKITGCEDPEKSVVSNYSKARYARIELDLDSIHTDEELHLPGVFIGVSSMSGGGTCLIKLDHIKGNSIDLREIDHITGSFQRLYFTSNGEGGTATLYVCQSGVTTITPNELTPYTGTIYSATLASTNDVRRLSDTHRSVLNRLKIRNADDTNSVEFGWIPKAGIDLPTAADFRGWSYRLVFQDDIEFTEIDLFRVGFCSTVDDTPVTIRLFGTKK